MKSRRPGVHAVMALALGALGLFSKPAAAQDTAPLLHLQFHQDGTVTLAASNVTTRDILAAWARECGCYVVNADRLTGAPLSVPLLFEKTPQATVLRSLLKQAAGYVLTPRRAGADGPSNFETIYVLATSSASSTPTYTQERAPAFSPVPVASPGSPNDEIPPVAIAIPDPVAPAKPAAEKEGNRVDTGVIPGMTVPAVRIVPILPVGASNPAPSTPAAPEPGKATPVPPPPAPLPGRN